MYYRTLGSQTASALIINELNTLQPGRNFTTKFINPLHVKIQTFTSDIISTNVIIANDVNSKCLYLLVDRHMILLADGLSTLCVGNDKIALHPSMFFSTSALRSIRACRISSTFVPFWLASLVPAWMMTDYGRFFNSG